MKNKDTKLQTMKRFAPLVVDCLLLVSAVAVGTMNVQSKLKRLQNTYKGIR